MGEVIDVIDSSFDTIVDEPSISDEEAGEYVYEKTTLPSDLITNTILYVDTEDEGDDEDEYISARSEDDETSVRRKLVLTTPMHGTAMKSNPKHKDCLGSSSSSGSDKSVTFVKSIRRNRRFVLDSSSSEDESFTAKKIHLRTPLSDMSNINSANFLKADICISTIKKKVNESALKMRDELYDAFFDIDSDASFILRESTDDSSGGKSSCDEEEKSFCDQNSDVDGYIEGEGEIEEKSHSKFGLLKMFNRSLSISKLSNNTKNFQKEKHDLAKSLFSEFNANVFDNKLPKDMSIEWNNRLRTTAGITITKYNKATDTYSAKIELSNKVVDCEYRLSCTLLHELCHASSWIINHVNKPSHGKVFKSWASRASAKYAEFKVTTKHTYAIHAQHKYECVNCKTALSRHSKSIDIQRKVCGKCKGKIQYLGNFAKDGTLKPRSTRVNKFSSYVQQHYGSIRKRTSSHQETMQHIASKWKQDKLKDQE